MERDPGAGPMPEPPEPEDATPEEDAEDLPREPGRLADEGRVVEEKGLEPGGERRDEP